MVTIGGIADKGALQRCVARVQSCIDLRGSAVAAHRHWAHDRLQAGDVADLRLYDRPRANHDCFGVFRGGNAEQSEGLGAAAPLIATASAEEPVDGPSRPPVS